MQRFGSDSFMYNNMDIKSFISVSSQHILDMSTDTVLMMLLSKSVVSNDQALLQKKCLEFKVVENCHCCSHPIRWDIKT